MNTRTGFLIVAALIIGFAVEEAIRQRYNYNVEVMQAEIPVSSSSASVESSSSSEPKLNQSPNLAQNLTDERADALADEAVRGRAEALNALEKAASAGSPSGAYGMAAYYLKRDAGLGASECDPIDWNYLATVDPRFARDMKRLLKMAAKRQKEHEQVCGNAVSWLEKASAQSDPAAQYELGSRYLLWQFTYKAFLEHVSREILHGRPWAEDAFSKAMRKHDCEKGLLLLEKSATARFAPAELRLGVEYEIPGNLTCVSRNENVARYWLRRSALDGSAKAAIFLANSYVSSQPTDFEEAKRWLTRAEELGIDSSDQVTACEMALYYGDTGDSDEAEQWQAKCRTPDSPPGEQTEQPDDPSKEVNR